MKNVVLINPANNLQSHYIYRKVIVPAIPPGNLTSLAAVAIQDGHNVDIVDQFLKLIDNDLLSQQIIERGYDLVGITCLTPSDATVRDLARRLRKRGFAGRIVLGNTHASIQSESFLNEGTIDAIVHGEGEQTLREILANDSLDGIDGISYKKNGSIVKEKRRKLISDLDTLPFPAWDRIETQLYDRHPILFMYQPTLPVQASRGCNYNCYMCTQDALLKKFRTRSAARAVAEIQNNIEQHHITGFCFLDSYFPPTTEWGWQFVEEIRKAGLAGKFRFCIETRADSVVEDLFTELVDIGCHNVAVGFDSGSDESLTRIGKHTTVSDNRQAMNVLRKLGVSSTGFFMIGFPWENESAIRETIAHANELSPDLVKINIAVPMPGSRFYKDMKAREEVTFDFEEMNAWSGVVKNGLLNQKQEFSQTPYRQLLRTQRLGMLQHYLKPRIWVRHMKLGTIRMRNVIPMAVAALSFLKGMFGRRN